MICGKQIYSTKQEATNTIKGLQNDRRQFRSKKRPSSLYFCADCQGWHVTTGSSGRRKRRKLIQDDSNINSIEKAKKQFKQKSGNHKILVHTRLNFKIK